MLPVKHTIIMQDNSDESTTTILYLLYTHKHQAVSYATNYNAFIYQ